MEEWPLSKFHVMSQRIPGPASYFPCGHAARKTPVEPIGSVLADRFDRPTCVHSSLRRTHHLQPIRSPIHRKYEIRTCCSRDCKAKALSTKGYGRHNYTDECSQHDRLQLSLPWSPVKGMPLWWVMAGALP
jgi:hypothetical protein